VDHFLPFQCNASLRVTLLAVLVKPTAQQLPRHAQETATSSLASEPAVVPPGSGVVTLNQVLPFQCKAWLTKAPLATS